MTAAGIGLKVSGFIELKLSGIGGRVHRGNASFVGVVAGCRARKVTLRAVEPGMVLVALQQGAREDEARQADAD